MLKHPDLTIGRIKRFIENTVAPSLWLRQCDLHASAWQPTESWPRRTDSITPSAEVAAPNAPPDDQYRQIEEGYSWGPVWSDCWFHFTGTVPMEWQGCAVVARIDCGSEAVAWDGANPLQGLDSNHGELAVAECAAGGESVSLYIRANGMNPNVSVDLQPLDPSPTPFTFGHGKLAVLEPGRWQYYYDVRVVFEVMMELPRNEPRFGQILRALNEVVNLWDGTDTGIEQGRKRLAPVLARKATASAHQLSAIGHAHIDTAWLWPLERTQQKCIHTFSTAVAMMDQYPEYKFICSQPQQYAWVKELAPALYERIREKIKAGQWEVTGSMWVEADCNITGGESLVRQLLYGKRFFMREFGIETRDIWLPDVFGYAACLPQLMDKAGIEFFLTQKISWNQINKFPHHTFLWQGIDGTQIFTHFPPVDTYCAMVTPKELLFNVHNYKDHDRGTRSMYVFGYGDGGGGPTAKMLEYARRLEDLEGMPTLTIEKASDFFAKAVEDSVDLPIWIGELYLELHRGTYTSQARNKLGNRKSEFLLRDAEAWAAFSPAGLSAYPCDRLERAWKLTLLNQFHDIIPGSSVNEVYRDSDEDYAEIAALGGQVVGDALGAFAAEVNTVGHHLPVMVARTAGQPFGELVTVELPESAHPVSVQYEAEMPMPVQVVVDGRRRCALFLDQSGQEGVSYSVYDLKSAHSEHVSPLLVTSQLLDNGQLRVELNEHGCITRIFDQVFDREVLAPGVTGNQLWLFEDTPLFWDAWDVDVFYQEKGEQLLQAEDVDVVEDGPVRGAIRVVRRFGESRIIQTIRLAATGRRLEFVTEVDWHEKHKMLKAAFPVDINSSRAAYEIQYGQVERPTHYNTSWDMARFEVAAQKWADICEGDYGVALLNDCKYGYDIQGSTLRLSLLRAPTAPDPEADMGWHTFTYALLPHGGGFGSVEVVEQAYHLNAPARALLLQPNIAGQLPRKMALLSVSREGVVIEAVKKAEDESAIVVRFYDAVNRRGAVTLNVGVPVSAALLCDLLERDIAPLEVRDNGVTVDIKPFEIVTVKLKLA